ncbi:unnamed protein product [Rotaria socialis]|uniref:Uncharacterized protein n=1 Tax=Rotaria socialis TaxID=392032 RepID=A0A818KMP2_9BILA|nr:unnamed protein product [Rotaria socialis]
MTDYDMEIPELNPDIGLHLVNFLNGTDASKFLEVVNNCSQFVSIGTASDRLFVEIMKKSDGRARILLPAEIYGNYLQDCEILDDKLVPFENQNPSVIQPAQRLFVHSCFSTKGLGALCKAYRTPLFQCYSRVLPFNTDLYCADFRLIDYQLYNETISSERDLNVYENKFFKISSKIEQFLLDSGSTINWNDLSQMLPDLSSIRFLSNLRALSLGLLEVSFHWIVQLVATTPCLIKLKPTGLVDADEQSKKLYHCEKAQVPLCALNLNLVCNGDDNDCNLYYGEVNQWWNLRGMVIVRLVTFT